MRYRIVCTEQTGCTSSGHIVAVGTGDDPGQASTRFTVAEVWNMMDRGHGFFTKDSYGNVAEVSKYPCPCGRGSLRSARDASRANNLDEMRLCSWRAA